MTQSAKQFSCVGITQQVAKVGATQADAFRTRSPEHHDLPALRQKNNPDQKSGGTQARRTVRFITAAGECEVSGDNLTVRMPDASGPVARFDLRKAAEASGLSINELARQIGVPQQTLNRCLVHRQIPYPATMKKIADFFGVSVAKVKCSFSSEANP